jgi:hypothetical protein
MSRGEMLDPKLWKLLLNMATVVKRTANGKEDVRPGGQEQKWENEEVSTWQGSGGIDYSENGARVLGGNVGGVDHD